MSMVPLEVETEGFDEDAQLLGGEQQSRFYTCHVCGDNWLSVRLTEPNGGTRITFVHQMGMQPILKRVGVTATPVILTDETIDRWDYFVGDDTVGEGEWRAVLDERRFVLRSVCSN